jgi:hypothetical protein
MVTSPRNESTPRVEVRVLEPGDEPLAPEAAQVVGPLRGGVGDAEQSSPLSRCHASRVPVRGSSPGAAERPPDKAAWTPGWSDSSSIADGTSPLLRFKSCRPGRPKPCSNEASTEARRSCLSAAEVAAAKRTTSSRSIAGVQWIRLTCGSIWHHFPDLLE